MPIICDNCGKKIVKYCIVRYEIDYLEKYLEEYFGKNIYELINTNIRKGKALMERAICFTVLVDFSGISFTNLVGRYKMSATAGRSSLDFLSIRNDDYQFVQKDLSNNLPEIIKEHLNGH